MTESAERYFPTARERLNRGENPQSPRRNDANNFFSSDAPGRNLDASTIGGQRSGRSRIKVQRLKR